MHGFPIFCIKQSYPFNSNFHELLEELSYYLNIFRVLSLFGGKEVKMYKCLLYFV